MADTDREDERIVLEALAAAIEPAPLDAARRESMRARVQARVSGATPEGKSTIRAGEGVWRPFLPLIDVKVLHRDAERGRQTALYRMQPGAAFPPHAHADDEECLVLEGEVSVGDLRLHAGDFHCARRGSQHPRLESRPGALLLISHALHP
jgi:anti-sigma factor ChrR (cupin superfamily)